MKDSNEIIYDSFKLPSCCVCMYSVNPDQMTRMGGDIENRKFIQSHTEPLKKSKEMFNRNI